MLGLHLQRANIPC